MKINLLCIGKTSQKEMRYLIQYYETRLPKYWNFELVEIPDIKNAKNLTPTLLKKEETAKILQQIDPADMVILLDEKGKTFTSRNFAKKIEDLMGFSMKKIHFVIGGAYGFSEEMYERAQQKIAISKMTFTHQMVRLFFIEQLYRANQILQGKPYHND